MAHLLHTRDVFAVELKRLTAEHDGAKGRLRELFGEIESRDAQIEELRGALAEQEGEFETLQTRKLEILRGIDHERNTITLSEQRIADAQAAEIAAREQIETLEQQIDGLNRELASGQVEIEEHEKALRRHEQSLAAQEERLTAEAAALEQAEIAVADAARRALELRPPRHEADQRA